MESSQFDRFARALGTRRTVVAALGAALGATAPTGFDAGAKKKKKKKCAKKCKDGCCTGKKGKCIRPDQQGTGQCGTGGEICRSSGCPTRCSASAPCPTDQCCGGDGTCGACLAFVSSAGYLGNLGGLTGADAKCQSLAAAANLPGAYMAWLSDSTGSPATRFTRATTPYSLRDGSVIAQNWTTLTDGSLDHPLNVTEAGATLSTETYVWTSTRSNGMLDSGPPSHCNNWTQDTNAFTGDVGRALASTGAWTDNGPAQCGYLPRHLYCFQQR